MNVRRYAVVARSFQGRPRKHFPSVTAVAFASGDYRRSLDKHAYVQTEDIARRRTRMILEFEMYAPYRLSGASVKFVPFHAAMPPPQARFASVTFSNHLYRIFSRLICSADIRGRLTLSRSRTNLQIC